MKQRLLLFLFFGMSTTLFAHTNSIDPTDEKSYFKEYYPDGTLQAEGWAMGDMKMGYWKLYHPNGKLAAKGHFRNNKKDRYWHFYNRFGKLVKEGHYKNESVEDWWIFYDPENSRKTKIQFKENQKHGYALRYNNGKLIKVERFENNEKTGEWTSIIAFKIDNPGVSW